MCDLNVLWELPSRWAKFCEILSHNVRYGMYVVSVCSGFSLLVCIIRFFSLYTLFTNIYFMTPSLSLSCYTKMHLCICMDVLWWHRCSHFCSFQNFNYFEFLESYVIHTGLFLLRHGYKAVSGCYSAKCSHFYVLGWCQPKCTFFLHFAFTQI